MGTCGTREREAGSPLRKFSLLLKILLKIELVFERKTEIARKLQGSLIGTFNLSCCLFVCLFTHLFTSGDPDGRNWLVVASTQFKPDSSGRSIPRRQEDWGARQSKYKSTNSLFLYLFLLLQISTTRCDLMFVSYFIFKCQMGRGLMMCLAWFSTGGRGGVTFECRMGVRQLSRSEPQVFENVRFKAHVCRGRQHRPADQRSLKTVGGSGVNCYNQSIN